jgi:hypothetical protein
VSPIGGALRAELIASFRVCRWAAKHADNRSECAHCCVGVDARRELRQSLCPFRWFTRYVTEDLLLIARGGSRVGRLRKKRFVRAEDRYRARARASVRRHRREHRSSGSTEYKFNLDKNYPIMQRNSGGLVNKNSTLLVLLKEKYAFLLHFHIDI